MEIKLIEDGIIVNSVHLVVSPKEYLVISSALTQFIEDLSNAECDISIAKEMRKAICTRAESEVKDVDQA